MIKGPPKPCAVPSTINITGLFACLASNNCGCTSTPEVTVPAVELAAFEAKARTSLSGQNLDLTDITEDAHQTHVAKYWGGLVGAYRELYKRTCYRFHGCTLSARIAAPVESVCCCPREIVCCCSSQTNGYDITRIDTVFDTAEHAELVEYTTAGTNRYPIDMPGRAPVDGAVWKIRRDEGRTYLTGQKRTAADTLPTLPAQDMTLPAGAEGTSALLVEFDEEFDPAFINAVYQLALLDVDKCSPDCQCGIGKDVTSASDDGYTIGFSGGGGVPNTSIALQWRSLGFTSIEAIDDVLVRYACKPETAEFATTSAKDKTWVAETFWSTSIVATQATTTPTGSTIDETQTPIDVVGSVPLLLTFATLSSVTDVTIIEIATGQDAGIGWTPAGGNQITLVSNVSVSGLTVTAQGPAA